jgi:hypothetical protein
MDSGDNDARGFYSRFPLLLFPSTHRGLRQEIERHATEGYHVLIISGVCVNRMAATRRGIRRKTMNGKAKQLEEDVEGVDLCGFFPQPRYRYQLVC